MWPCRTTLYGFGLGGGPGSAGGGGSYFFAAPFFTFYPSPENLYSRWLLLNVVDGKYYREKGQFRTIWVGEARSTGTSADLRTAINYLLLADFKQFGQNTGKAVKRGDQRGRPPGAGLDQVREVSSFEFLVSCLHAPWHLGVR